MDFLFAALFSGSILIFVILLRIFLAPFINQRAKDLITQYCEDAGVILGKDLIINSDDVYFEWIRNGVLGIGETYLMKNWKAIMPLDEIFTKLMLLPSEKKRTLFKSWNAKLLGLGARITNYQSRSRAGIIGAHHYDLGNEFFELWLDSRMQYSCAYWKNAESLEEAQLAKLKLVANKLKLKPGMKVLEVGFGWGGLACFLAKNYGVQVTGITVSKEQLHGAEERAEKEGVADLVNFKYSDYREMKEQYDRVVSIAMLEAVGYKNLREYFSMIGRCLKPGGIAVIHSICDNKSFKVAVHAWMTKYIFPNGFLPSLAQMCKFSEGLLVVEDVQNIGPDYDRTLLEWNKRFQKRVELGTIDKPQTFVRMWEFYLLFCAAGFRSRANQVFQVVYSKKKFQRFDR